MRALISIIAIVFLYLFNTASILADSNFSTDYNVIYTIRENGITNVNFDVVLTNKTSQYYASSYNVKVGFNDIENAKAFDPDGTIVPVIFKKNDETSIEVNFNKRAVGINSKLNFNISFDTKSVAKKVGKVWEIYIPGLSNQDSFQSFNVSVMTPNSIGKPSYIKPEIAKSGKNSLTFTKDQLGNSGIYIGFGDFQLYKFNLTYHINNPNLFKVKTEIALPLSTNYQDVEIEDIYPKPQNVVLDNDGNWLAEYLLLPSRKVDIVVKGNAKIYLKPRIAAITKEEVELYTKEQPNWEVSNPVIKNLAQKLKTPQAIYEYVVNNLSYDINRVVEKKERLGAVSVLKNPNSAVCLEFTDLFIALARAAGIPAREINGFAYTQTPKERPLSLVKDILHAWPEFYDFKRQTWVMVDPTWGNTTKGLDYFQELDFDHFAFIIKGENSEYPVPAGGYKLEGQEALKDVDVSFSQDFDMKNSQFAIDLNLSKSYAAGLPIKGDMVIRNIGKTLLSPQIATVAAAFLKPSPQQFFINSIPPFGHITYDVIFQEEPFLTNRVDVVTIAIKDHLSSKSVEIYPFFLHKTFYLVGGILFATFVVIILSVVAVKTGRLSFFGGTRSSFIRWKGKEPQN